MYWNIWKIHKVTSHCFSDCSLDQGTFRNAEWQLGSKFTSSHSTLKTSIASDTHWWSRSIMKCQMVLSCESLIARFASQRTRKIKSIVVNQRINPLLAKYVVLKLAILLVGRFRKNSSRLSSRIGCSALERNIAILTTWETTSLTSFSCITRVSEPCYQSDLELVPTADLADATSGSCRQPCSVPRT
jgi:hypothetical protein